MCAWPPASPLDVKPGFGPGDVTWTISCGAGTGRDRSSSRSNTEKIAVLTPMPSPSDSTATDVTNGRLSSERTA